ncbi:MAG: chemotaxis-specific protein-glutamate methyltransferase CheB [Thermodesulfobacteriota bacterium]
MSLKGIIRVLIVEDSPLMCKMLTSTINSDPKLLVVGTAYNGKEAVELVPKLRPHVITMDINLPVMDGFEATKQIMAYNPTPIIVLSLSVFKGGMDKAFKAISYGALEVVEKAPLESTQDNKVAKQLIEKIKFLARVKVIHHPLAKIERRKLETIDIPKRKGTRKIIAIVASTGGPDALLRILKRLPKEFASGIVIVQHISNGFTEGLAEWLDSECQIRVKIAEDSEEIKAGIAYIAPSCLHMEVKTGERIGLTKGDSLHGHIPSGDILMESVGRVYKREATGIILTGMGRDGANGMRIIRQYHGNTIAQDEETSIIFGMPKAAIDMNIVDMVMPLDKIADEIVRILQ